MAKHAERITDPGELELPAALDVMREVFSELSGDHARSFVAALLESLERVGATADLRPLNDVMEAWYRALLFARRGGLEEAIRQAAQMTGSEKGLDLEELLEEHGLPEPDREGVSRVRILPRSV